MERNVRTELLLTYIFMRTIRGLLTLLFVVTLVFFGLRLSGDPVSIMLGDTADPAAIEAMRENLGLDEPLPVQYVRYFENVARGDFGDSIRNRRPASEVVAERLPATLKLSAITLALTIFGGIAIGVLAALNRNSLIDRAVMTLSFLGQAAPSFFVGILLILLLSLRLDLLPSYGATSWKHYVMPVITLSAYGMATMARLTRSSVLEVVSEDYVRTARAKGLRSFQVVGFHILRNAAIPVITQIGLMFAGAISGAVVVETVFAWPGMGRLVADSVFERDYPVIQLIVLMIAASVVIVNLMIDIMYGWIDPRIRLTGSSR